MLKEAYLRSKINTAAGVDQVAQTLHLQNPCSILQQHNVRTELLYRRSQRDTWRRGHKAWISCTSAVGKNVQRFNPQGQVGVGIRCGSGCDRRQQLLDDVVDVEHGLLHFPDRNCVLQQKKRESSVRKLSQVNCAIKLRSTHLTHLRNQDVTPCDEKVVESGRLQHGFVRCEKLQHLRNTEPKLKVSALLG